MKKNKDMVFLLFNILLPLVIGALIYYMVFPDVIFVEIVDDLFGIGRHVCPIMYESLIIRFIRNYMMDMLWGYALVFLLCLVLGNKTAERMKAFIISFMFSIVMELLQLTPIVKGTFDVFDIAVEFLAELTAVFIIRKISTRRKKEI